MFSKVSVLVPTRKRISRLQTLIDSFDATTGNGPETELLFRVDFDDPKSRDFLIAWGGHQVVTGPRLNGYSSMGTFFNELTSCSSGDVFICGNDDMIFKTPGWPAKVLAAANKFPDGVFNLGVSIFNQDHYPLCIVSKILVRTLGFIWDPAVFWGDIYLRDVVGAFDRLSLLSEVEIEHDWAGHVPDETFAQAKQNEIWARDPTYWAGTHATAVAEAVSKLRVLL